jgi:hypothetical protein
LAKQTFIEANLLCVRPRSHILVFDRPAGSDYNR